MSQPIDAAEVAKHNTKDSCWVILYGNVYDVRFEKSLEHAPVSLTVCLGHNLPPQPSRWQQNNPQALRPRRDRRIRSHPPSGYPRREPPRRSKSRTYQSKHAARTCPKCLIRERRRAGHPSRAPPRGAPQPRRDRSSGDQEDEQKGLGLLLQRIRRPALQKPKQHRLPLHPPPSPRFHRLHAVRPQHHIPRLQAAASRLRESGCDGETGASGWRMGHGAGV
jgi:hypothetical protein